MTSANLHNYIIVAPELSAYLQEFKTLSILFSMAHCYDRANHFLYSFQNIPATNATIFLNFGKLKRLFPDFGPLDRWLSSVLAGDLSTDGQHAHSHKGYGAADEHKKHTDSGAAEKFSLLLREFRGLLNKSQSLEDTLADPCRLSSLNQKQLEASSLK